MPVLACAGTADASTLLKSAIDAKARAIGNKSLRFHTAALAAGDEPTETIEAVVLKLAAQTKHGDARVKNFIRFLDVSPPNKNSQTNGFSPKFPTFFLCKKNQMESDGWTSLVSVVSYHTST